MFIRQQPKSKDIGMEKNVGSEKLRTVLKNLALSVGGLMQGILGSYFALLGFAFAFPETEPGMRDYEEDMFFVPFGYIMLIWVAVMISVILLLRKNKAGMLSFFLSWFVGVIGCIVFVLVIH